MALEIIRASLEAGKFGADAKLGADRIFLKAGRPFNTKMRRIALVRNRAGMDDAVLSTRLKRFDHDVAVWVLLLCHFGLVVKSFVRQTMPVSHEQKCPCLNWGPERQIERPSSQKKP